MHKYMHMDTQDIQYNEYITCINKYTERALATHVPVLTPSSERAITPQ